MKAMNLTNLNVMKAKAMKPMKSMSWTRLNRLNPGRNRREEILIFLADGSLNVGLPFAGEKLESPAVDSYDFLRGGRALE
jgi:hypothetical protein